MEKNIQQLPTKRFPQFNNEWRRSQLGDFAITVTSGSRDWAQYYSDKGSKFIRMTNLSKGGIQLLLDELKFVELDEDSSEGKRTSLQENDILISITAELGKIGIIPSDFGTAYINQHTALVRLDSKKADARFVAYKLSSKTMNNKINRLNDSGAKAGLNLPTVRSFPIAVPTLPEQRKIADFLTAVDGRIGQLIQKKALLENYKKGVMQQFFTQDIRFKDDHGNDFPDWEEKKLGEVGVFLRGLSYNSTNVSESGLLVLRSTNIQGQNLILDRDLQFVDVDCPDKIALRKGDIAICMSNGSKRLVGKSAIYDGAYTQPVTVGAFCSIFRTESRMAPYLLQSGLYAKYLHVLLAGTNINNLKNTDLAELSFSIPSDENEQTKIADFLSAIDRKIESIATQITETQTFKRGLLQQMFV